MKTRLSIAAVLLALFAIPAFGAYDTFVKFGDIKGESTDQNHKDWIEVSSFSFGTTHAVGPTTTTHGAATMPKVTLTVRQGRYLAQLGAMAASGQHIPTVIIDVATERYTLQDVIISSYSAASMGGGATTSGASLTLSFAHYSMAVAARPAPMPGASVMPATEAHVAIVPPNAQVIVNGVPGERFDLLALRFTSEHDGVLKIREAATSPGFFQQSAASKASNGKVQVKKDYLVFTLTNCTITSFSRSADGTSSAGFHFDQYQGPVGGFQP